MKKFRVTCSVVVRAESEDGARSIIESSPENLTFSLDLIQQLKKGEWAPMLTNLLVQTIGSVILCGIGLALADRFSQTNH